jgi:hypothetical protein
MSINLSKINLILSIKIKRQILINFLLTFQNIDHINILVFIYFFIY